MSFTYAQLKQALQDQMLGNDEPTFVNNLPVFIRLAENRIVKDSQLAVFRGEATPSLTQGQQTVSLEDDFLAPLSLSLLVSGERILLEQKDTTFLDAFWPEAAEEGVPRYYALVNESTAALAPTPAAAYTATLRYLRAPESLTAGGEDDSTWLSTNAPDAMLYGSLIEAGIFLKSPEDVMQAFSASFSLAITRLKHLGESLQTIDQHRHGQLRTPRS